MLLGLDERNLFSLLRPISLRRKMNTQDPLHFLPEELFGSIQLFLPPSSRAISSRTSQRWRKAINNNLTLHQEIDLSHLFRGDVKPFKVIHHLHHLASRSSNTLTKVALYLKGFDEGFEGGQQDWETTLLSIPFMILLPSSGRSPSNSTLEEKKWYFSL